MRVLFIRRQRFGGIATHTKLLADALDKEGVEAVIDDADDWIPNQTGGKVDRETSRKVVAAMKGFDLVHAFGHRTAWACSEAFHRGPWLATTFDMPKTVHPQLIERLNNARANVASTHSVRAVLENAKTARVQTIYPGVPANRRVLDRDEARAMLGVTDDLFLIAVAGRFIPEHSIDTAIYVVDALPYFARLIVTGQGEQEQELRRIARERVTFKTDPFSQQTAIAAADVVVVPSTVAGFSMTAIESMLQGTPVAMRRVGGLTEIGEDQRTGFFFETDEELLDLLNHLIYKKEQLREVGRAARQRVIESFDVAVTANAHANLYRQVLA